MAFPKSPILFNFIKAVVLFPSALYLFGFSLNGVNFYGSVDALIPVERVLALFGSVGLFVMFGVQVLGIWRFTK